MSGVKDEKKRPPEDPSAQLNKQDTGEPHAQEQEAERLRQWEERLRREDERLRLQKEDWQREYELQKAELRNMLQQVSAGTAQLISSCADTRNTDLAESAHKRRRIVLSKATTSAPTLNADNRTARAVSAAEPTGQIGGVRDDPVAVSLNRDGGRGDVDLEMSDDEDGGVDLVVRSLSR
jgi:hypothetical protein